ncbi:uncharacterized protein LOC141649983 [Silene latifolia]|uniref:uncharacterized protein LOC141649983 n=1 Tax=Silene latifolia TaxID=37657 RepID=UPI003D77F974
MGLSLLAIRQRHFVLVGTFHCRSLLPETLSPMAVSPKNKIIVENLRKKLEEIGGKWAEELPLVLWADRTTPKVATGQTPFSLVFGAEAVIPSEVRVPTHRYGCLTEERNQVEMASSLDTVDELRTSAQIRMASYSDKGVAEATTKM